MKSLHEDVLLTKYVPFPVLGDILNLEFDKYSTKYRYFDKKKQFCFAPYGGSQTDTASCCTFASPCGINEGDCDNNFECQGELMCGIDNCINLLPSDNFPSTHDCCFAAASKCGGSQTDTASCCTSVSPCGINEGDCDDNFECQGVLMCGIDNCINILPSDDIPSTHDCCYSPFLCDGNSSNDIDSCCRTWNPCGENEGDCDSNAECHEGLVCGTNNCMNILAHQKYEPTHDCCHDPLTTFKCDGRQANAADCCKFFIMSEEFCNSFLSEEPILDISVQGVKSLGGHFACFCQEFDFHEVKKYFIIIFQKGKYFYTF